MMGIGELVPDGDVIEERDQSLLLELRSSYEEHPQRKKSVKCWMADNRDGLSEKFREMFPNGRIDWIWLTKWFQDNGFRNRDGSDLKKCTVKETWRRVVSERSKAGG